MTQICCFNYLVKKLVDSKQICCILEQLESICMWKDHRKTFIFLSVCMACIEEPWVFAWMLLGFCILQKASYGKVTQKKFNYRRNFDALQLLMFRFCQVYEMGSLGYQQMLTLINFKTIIAAATLLLLCNWLVSFRSALQISLCAGIVSNHAIFSEHRLFKFLQSFPNKAPPLLLPPAKSVVEVKTTEISPPPIVIENQRWWLGIGWTPSTMRNDPPPFQTENLPGSLEDARQRYRWKVDLTGTYDPEGWSYADNDWNNWSPIKGVASYTRRRRWIVA